MQNRDGVSNIIVDLTKVLYCDSSGLSALLVGHRVCKDANGIFILSALQPSVEKLISLKLGGYKNLEKEESG